MPAYILRVTTVTFTYINTASHLDFFFQAEDGIRDSVASRGLGDVYKRQIIDTEPKVDDRGLGLLQLQTAKAQSVNVALAQPNGVLCCLQHPRILYHN